VFGSNILSMFWLCRAAIPRLQPGSTINQQASVQAYDPSPQLIHYATTKRAIVTFTKPLARQLRARDSRQRRRAGTDVDAVDPDVDAG
jgi:NAD(P)-dependent dehydrogenase (short-subunit alcohol dehydrogenase family)